MKACLSFFFKVVICFILAVVGFGCCRAFSLVAENEGYSASCSAWASHCRDFSLATEHRLRSVQASVVAAPGL